MLFIYLFIYYEYLLTIATSEQSGTVINEGPANEVLFAFKASIIRDIII